MIFSLCATNTPSRLSPVSLLIANGPMTVFRLPLGVDRVLTSKLPTSHVVDTQLGSQTRSVRLVTPVVGSTHEGAMSSKHALSRAVSGSRCRRMFIMLASAAHKLACVESDRLSGRAYHLGLTRWIYQSQLIRQ